MEYIYNLCFNVKIYICLVKYLYTISKYTIKCDYYLQKILSISNNYYIDYAYKNTLYLYKYSKIMNEILQIYKIDIKHG